MAHSIEGTDSLRRERGSHVFLLEVITGVLGSESFFSGIQGKAGVYLRKKSTYYNRGVLLGFKVYLSRSNTY